MNKRKLLAFALVCLLTLGCCSLVGTAESGDTPLLVGAAIRDVTPTIENGMLPIAGIGRDAGPIVDVIDPIHTRIIALQSGETTALIVCTETGKGPYGPQFAALLSEHTGIPVDAIFYTTTHTHSAPEITSEIDLDFKEGEEVDTKQLWGKYVLEQMCSGADEALANLQPAKVAVGYGESFINVNRNRIYTRREDGSTYVELGYNPTGISDKTLTVLRFDSLDDKPIAFLINYPMHMVTMIANTYFDGQTGISADINGYVSTLLEKENEGAVAVWTSGAAGDQNPISSNQVMIPVPETGELLTYYTGDYDIMKYWGSIHFADILSVLNTMDEGIPNLNLAYASGSSTLPTREDVEADGFDIHLKVLRIGDIALVGSPGELFTSLGMYMKESSSLENTIIFNHTWTQEGSYNGYIGDDYALVNGGYGVRPARATYAVGTISDGLADLMNELIAQTE